MERTIIPPEFKGGIWHKFFTIASKKDETLVSILDEKIRYYKLYYPFLEKKQILGKAYEELGIPHICGDLNRKELHKLFLKERKNQSKLNEKYKKYPTLLIENKSKNKGTIKKPTISLTKQIKVNNVHTNVEKSKGDCLFDNLLSNFNTKRKEGMIQNMNFKQTKSVRFNDGIEVHSVSPSQPLYKLKPLGRLFDEPSVVRAVETPAHSEQELEEKIEDSDSDFDADTGITSDVEDYDLEDSPQKEDLSKRSEIIENEKVEENSLQDTNAKAIYDCSEDDSQSIDHEIRKEGNDLILTSKMITVVQGKWVRETKQIIGDTCHNKDIIMSNKKYAKEDPDDKGLDFAQIRNIERILENFKSLCISNKEELDKSSDVGESELNTIVKKEQLMVGKIKMGQDLTNIEITIQDKDEPKQNKKMSCKTINSKISLENNSSTHLIDEKLLTIDNNKLSYEHDIYEMNNNEEENIERRIRKKPIKLIDDLIDYINDWNSSNDGSLSHKESLTLSTKPIYIKDSENDKYMKAKEVKNIINSGGSSEYSFNEEGSCLDKNEDDFEKLSSEEETCLEREEDKLKDSPLGEKHYLDKEEDHLIESPLGEKSYLNQSNYSPLIFVNNNLHQVESEVSLDTMSKSIEIIKTELSSSSDMLRSIKEDEAGYEADDVLITMSISKRNESPEEKELQINDTFAIIKNMMGNQNISNTNELYSTFGSLITKPILIQSHCIEAEGGDKDNYNKLKSFEAEELCQENEKIQSGYSGYEYQQNSGYHVDTKIIKMAEGGNETNEDINKRHNEENPENNVEENSKILIGTKLLKNSDLPSMDYSNSSLVGKRKEKDSREENSKIFVTDKKLFYDEPENILDPIETTKMYEGHIAVESEKDHKNFFSKVQMWSLHSKNYSGNSTMVSQTSSVLASCNTDSLQTKVVGLEDSIKTTDDQKNESNYSNLSHVESLTSGSDEEDDILEDLDNKSMDLETGSSTRTVTPVKMEKTNSEEVSTAYETDPETGRLVMNRSLRPISNSTPIKLEESDEEQDSDLKLRIDKNSFEEVPTYSFQYIKENQCFEHNTKSNKSLSASVIEESIIKSDSQYRELSKISELSSRVSILAKHDKRNELETNGLLNSSEKEEKTSKTEIGNNEKSYLNDFSESLIEIHAEVFSGTDMPLLQSNSNKSNSGSIIENSETVRAITSHPVCTGKQHELSIERYAKETDVNPLEISIKCNSPDQLRNSNEATYGSSIQPQVLCTSKEKVALNVKANDKISADSHSTDIIYDTSSLTDDNKIGKFTKTSVVSLGGAIEECTSENKHFINENELNVVDELIIVDNKKKLSAVSESINNNNDKLTMGVSENLDLEMEENFLKTYLKNRQGNVSHVTFLIRDPISPESSSCNIESAYRQLTNLSHLQNTSKLKQQDPNKEQSNNEFLFTTTKSHTKEDKNDDSMDETLKLPKLNHLDVQEKGSHFSIGVENSHIEPSLLSSHNEEHQYFTRPRTYLSLKRKLGTINENDSGSDISLSQDEFSKKELKFNVSTVAKYSESPVTTDTSSIEMNLKRVNTDIRRKRAKLKKENPVRRSSTSSSDDEVVKPSVQKGKGLESSKLISVYKCAESNMTIKQSNNIVFEDNINTISQENIGRSYTNPKTDMPTEHNHFSDTSSSIIYSSPNAKTGLEDKMTKTYDKVKTHFDKNIRKRHVEESSYFTGNAKSAITRSGQSHISYPLKCDDSNKENSNIPLKHSRPYNEYSKKPLKKSIPGKSDTALDGSKNQSEANSPHQSIKKFRKSSIVRLMGTDEANQISNSPEVKGLLRRTYFMGNN